MNVPSVAPITTWLVGIYVVLAFVCRRQHYTDDFVGVRTVSRMLRANDIPPWARIDIPPCRHVSGNGFKPVVSHLVLPCKLVCSALHECTLRSRDPRATGRVDLVLV